MINLREFERRGRRAIEQAKKENEIYNRFLIPFAKKIGLYKPSKDFEESGRKAILWEKEKTKYKLNF
jgi:hypothetical protein